jgi:hypothetical protein
MEDKKIHGQVEYRHADGHWVHSDTCPPGCIADNLTEEHRQYLHDCLDEYLDSFLPQGRGFFYIGNEADLLKELSASQVLVWSESNPDSTGIWLSRRGDSIRFFPHWVDHCDLLQQITFAGTRYAKLCELPIVVDGD